MENLPPDEVLKNLKLKADERKKWRPINQARFVMHFISALLILSTIIVFFSVDTMAKGGEIVFYVMLLIASLFIGLSFWTTKQPKLALTTTIVIFVGFLILSYIGDPSTGFDGLWWKIPILVMFIRGLLATKHLQVKQESQELLDDF